MPTNPTDQTEVTEPTLAQILDRIETLEVVLDALMTALAARGIVTPEQVQTAIIDGAQAQPTMAADDQPE
jgi:hypothetical protein